MVLVYIFEVDCLQVLVWCVLYTLQVSQRRYISPRVFLFWVLVGIPCVCRGVRLCRAW